MSSIIVPEWKYLLECRAGLQVRRSPNTIWVGRHIRHEELARQGLKGGSTGRVVWEQSVLTGLPGSSRLKCVPCDVCNEPTGDMQYEGPAELSIRQLEVCSNGASGEYRCRYGRVQTCGSCNCNTMTNCTLDIRTVNGSWDPRGCQCAWDRHGNISGRDCLKMSQTEGHGGQTNQRGPLNPS